MLILQFPENLFFDNRHCFTFFPGLFFHVVGEGVVNLARKAENITDKENYIDFRLRLLGEPGKNFFNELEVNFRILSRFRFPILLKSSYEVGCGL